MPHCTFQRGVQETQWWLLPHCIVNVVIYMESVGCGMLMNRIKDLHSKLDDLIERIKKALLKESISANGFSKKEKIFKKSLNNAKFKNIKVFKQNSCNVCPTLTTHNNSLIVMSVEDIVQWTEDSSPEFFRKLLLPERLQLQVLPASLASRLPESKLTFAALSNDCCYGQHMWHILLALLQKPR